MHHQRCKNGNSTILQTNLNAFSPDASFIKADVNQVKRVPGDAPASRAVREYLDVLDGDGADGAAEARGKRKKPPKAISLTDSLAAWVTKQNMRPFFAYDANYLIDSKLGIIVDAEGTRANRSEENRIARTMVRGLYT